MNNPLSSPNDYAFFIYALSDHYLSIQSSSLTYIPLGAKTGKVAGMIVFENNIILCVQEFLNFELHILEGYGYEISRSHAETAQLAETKDYCRASFPDKSKLYWYDSFPHPNDPSLSSTHPHHKHIHPNIKRNRIPAPDLTFTAPNLPFLIQEIERIALPSVSS